MALQGFGMKNNKNWNKRKMKKILNSKRKVGRSSWLDQNKSKIMLLMRLN